VQREKTSELEAETANEQMAVLYEP